MSAKFCPECGAEQRDGALFCWRCGARVGPPDGTPRPLSSRHSKPWAIVLAVCTAVGAIVVFVLASASAKSAVPGIVSAGVQLAPATAAELGPYARGTPLPSYATAAAVCPEAPDWAAVIASPTAYRGRCVWVYGFARFTAGPDRLFRLDDVPGKGASSVWVDFDPSGGPGAFWSQVDSSRFVFVLGTIQGVRDGLPYLVATGVYYAPGAAATPILREPLDLRAPTATPRAG